MNSLCLPALLTPAEVTALLKVSRRTLQTLCRRRKIRFIKIGAQLRFEREDLAEYLKKNTRAVRPF